MCTPDRCVEGKGKDPDWMVAGIAKAKAQIALERGAVQRFQSQDDYEDQRARLESFEMSPWSPTRIYGEGVL
jgi:hypothetical protein